MSSLRPVLSVVDVFILVLIAGVLCRVVSCRADLEPWVFCFGLMACGVVKYGGGQGWLAPSLQIADGS